MDHDCGVSRCGRPTQDTICATCTAELVDALRAIGGREIQRIRIHRDRDPAGGWVKREEVDYMPSLWEDLETTLTRQAKMGGAGIKVRGSGESPAPFHEAASEVKTLVLRAVRHWKAVFAAENPHLAAGPLPVPEVCVWIAQFPGLLAQLITAPAMHDDFVALAHPRRGSIQRVIDRAPDRIFLGICSSRVEGDFPCAEDVYAIDGNKFAVCRGCGAHHDVAARRERLRAAMEHVEATAVDCSRMSDLYGKPVTTDRIRKWKQRKILKPVGVDDHGRPRYLMRDVFDLAAGKTTERKAS